MSLIISEGIGPLHGRSFFSPYSTMRSRHIGLFIAQMLLQKVYTHQSDRAAPYPAGREQAYKRWRYPFSDLYQ